MINQPRNSANTSQSQLSPKRLLRTNMGHYAHACVQKRTKRLGEGNTPRIVLTSEAETVWSQLCLWLIPSEAIINWTADIRDNSLEDRAIKWSHKWLPMNGQVFRGHGPWEQSNGTHPPYHEAGGAYLVVQRLHSNSMAGYTIALNSTSSSHKPPSQCQ